MLFILTYVTTEASPQDETALVFVSERAMPAMRRRRIPHAVRAMGRPNRVHGPLGHRGNKASFTLTGKRCQAIVSLAIFAFLRLMR